MSMVTVVHLSDNLAVAVVLQWLMWHLHYYGYLPQTSIHLSSDHHEACRCVVLCMTQ